MKALYNGGGEEEDKGGEACKIWAKSQKEVIGIQKKAWTGGQNPVKLTSSGKSRKA